jgi:ATP-binding protein involved in chromosome partitioning
MSVSHNRPKLPGIEQIGRFIAVASGKGGVGKTSVAVNLALALKQRGLKIGLLDADVYGPSIPLMLGIEGAPKVVQGKMVPIRRYGIDVISIGFLIDENQAVIWRGPMVTRALKDFLANVEWGELDYLVVDLPPGTGDPSITIAQLLSKGAALMVTTPQAVALADVRKAISMFRKMEMPVLGIVENMSYFCCEHSDVQIQIFGSGGGDKLSRELGIPLLTSLPISMELREGGDSGVPIVEGQPDSEPARLFADLAERLVELERQST